jgi:hypothetical protein
LDPASIHQTQPTCDSVNVAWLELAQIKRGLKQDESNGMSLAPKRLDNGILDTNCASIATR